MQREWAEAKKELQEERQNARNITLDRDQTLKGAMKQVEDLGKQLADALHAVAAAESKAAAVEVVLILSRNCLFHVHFFLYRYFCALFDGYSNCNSCCFCSFRPDFQIWRKRSDLLGQRYNFRTDYDRDDKIDMKIMLVVSLVARSH